MNVTITIVADHINAAMLLQALAKATEEHEGDRTVDAASFAPKVKAAAIKALAETEPVDMPLAPGLEATVTHHADGTSDYTLPTEEDELPVEAPKVPKTPRKPKADKAVVGTIPTPPAKAPKVAKVPGAAPTRDEAKIAMEKYVGKHGTVGLVTKLGALGARRLSDVPDDKLDEFVKALDA